MSARPNVVVVITHDTGRQVEPYGCGVATPHLSRLAAEGIVFDNAFSAAPQCSPSRASMLTGLAPHAHGLIGLTHRGFRLHPASYRRTLPALLARAGYTTHLFGFQHESLDPHALGYEHVVQESSGRQFAQTVAPRAASFLRAGPSEPFFMMVGFSETHRPFAPTHAPLDDVQVPTFLPDNPIVRSDVAHLNGEVQKVDQAIGEILDALDAAGLAENTLVVFTTDHGIAFPGAKATLFDPGISISLIARGPSGFTGGKRIGGLVSNVDTFATVLALCAVEPPVDTHGLSLLPLVRGEINAVRDHVFAENTYQNAYDPMRAIRTTRYKYIRSFAERPIALPTHVDSSPTKDYFRDQGYFTRPRPRELLFDLERDPLERQNLADDPTYRPIRDNLRQRVEQHMEETGDPLRAGDIPAPARARLTPLEAYR